MGFARVRLSRTLVLLASAVGLAACVAQPGQYGYAPPAVVQTAPAGLPDTVRRRVAVLLPLSGPSADLGKSMMRAVTLAMPETGGPSVESQDTGGTPEGAARAARLAIADGAGIFIGPLTAAETAAVAPIAQAAHVPVLAFTSDSTQAQPGVWTLGITPGQQVRRLVTAVQADGRTRFGAILPANAFGDALAAGLTEALAANHLPPPDIVRQAAGPNGVTDALSQLAATAGLHGTSADPSAPVQPAQIDALLLGAARDALQQALPTLAGYQNGPDHLRLLGTALWVRDAPRLFLISGAWFAAPDPAPQRAFEQHYAARYGAPPRELAGLAFDAAAVARSIAGPNGFAADGLLRPDGFSGADGVFVLEPSGLVRRALALFEIDHNGAHVAQPGARNVALNVP